MVGWSALIEKGYILLVHTSQKYSNDNMLFNVRHLPYYHHFSSTRLAQVYHMNFILFTQFHLVYLFY